MILMYSHIHKRRKQQWDTENYIPGHFESTQHPGSYVADFVKETEAAIKRTDGNNKRTDHLPGPNRRQHRCGKRKPSDRSGYE
jgi:hypothetical protein